MELMLLDWGFLLIKLTIFFYPPAVTLPSLRHAPWQKIIKTKDNVLCHGKMVLKLSIKSYFILYLK